MHIGFASQSPSSHYWLLISYGARARAAELDAQLTIYNAYTLEEQISAINRLIEQRVDVLFVGPVMTSGLADAVARARAAGIPVIALAVELSDSDVTCTVRSDHMRGAELAAAFLAERLGGVGEVAHIIGPRHIQDNVDRAIGVRKVLDRYPGLQVVYEEESPNWRQDSGKALMRAALERHPNLRGVCVANDTLALGASAAIAEAGRTGEIIVTGFDADAEALVAIYDGRMGATVRQSTQLIGRTAVDLAQRVVAGEQVPSLVLTEIGLVSRENLTEALLDLAYLLPNVLRDSIERGEALARARDAIIDAQRAVLRELSTPLIPISDSVMVMPLIGTIDSSRARQIISALLEGVAAARTSTMIIDITGVPVVDSQVADILIHASQAVKLLGADVVLTGIRPEVAQTLVSQGIDLNGIVTLGTLQAGIRYAMRSKGEFA